ncbi:hypothetical protein Dsin_013454 [Dipteronia sinensis]|uniref:Uncharacterized protein n=1 Tax=Dipteronia sinensis TaxID=43782 RepID=A0AAE0AL87_9ROSI|nr:hypothetical protein Dsin_013454 [Dipteronia sinensis]
MDGGGFWFWRWMGMNSGVDLGQLGGVMLLAEILEIASKMLVVELKVVGGCGVGGVRVEFEELHWEDLQVGLQDIVHS